MNDDFSLDFDLNHTATPEHLLRGSGRLERLAWLTSLVSKGNPLFFLQDGERSRLVFQEAADSFVNGQFIAAISLGFGFIERAIAGRLWFIDQEKYGKRIRSDKLLQEALQREWITDKDYVAMDNLREVRNYVTHFRPPPSEKDVVRHIFTEHPKSIDFESQAKKTIEIAINVLHQTAL